MKFFTTIALFGAASALKITQEPRRESGDMQMPEKRSFIDEAKEALADNFDIELEDYDLEAVFQELDIDGDQEVAAWEVVDTIDYHFGLELDEDEKYYMEAEVESWGADFDKDGSGAISREEMGLEENRVIGEILDALVEEYGVDPADFEDLDLEAVFQELDIDGDQEIAAWEVVDALDYELGLGLDEDEKADLEYGIEMWGAEHDKDGSGALSRKEMGLEDNHVIDEIFDALVEEFDVDPAELEDLDLEEVFQGLDLDEDDEIAAWEVVETLDYYLELDLDEDEFSYIEAEIEMWGAEHDKDGSGALSRKEMGLEDVDME